MFSAIEKSGTGIEKSGTGIEKSGTGVGRGRWQAIALIAAALFAAPALATDPQVLVTSGDEQIFVSVHTDDGILVGRGAMQDDSGYSQVALYSAVGQAGSGAVLQPMVAGSGSGASQEVAGSAKEVAGSGSGSSKEVAGSGSGSSTEVAGSGSGSSTEVAGSGSGSAGEACAFGGGSMMVAGSGSGSATEGCDSVSQLMVAGSGSGSAGEGCVPGSGLDVAGSGSGSAGERSGCAVQPWGFAEIVVDADGTHVVVNRLEQSGAVEYLLAYLPGESESVSTSLQRGTERNSHEFVAMP